MAASDPANAYALSTLEHVPAVARPRGRGALLVTRAGRVIVSTEARGRRLSIAPGEAADTIRDALEALVAYLGTRQGVPVRQRDIIVDRIDEVEAAQSVHAPLLATLGFRRDGMRLRRDAPIAS
jgi:hypothetical protein